MTFAMIRRALQQAAPAILMTVMFGLGAWFAAAGLVGFAA